MFYWSDPGTGKTLVTRAVAGEANVPFFTIWIWFCWNVWRRSVEGKRYVWTRKEKCPCIIFVDEIDAVGRHRGAGLGGGNDEREQTLNQLLVEMDGFETNEGVILIAATNRPDVLDPALLRPGKFDRQVVVPNPDILGRKILKYIWKSSLAPDVNARVIAKGTPGFSGADLANIVNESALLAARVRKMYPWLNLRKPKIKWWWIREKINDNDWGRKRENCLSWSWACFSDVECKTTSPCTKLL